MELEKIKAEINTELANKETLAVLVDTTFKGLNPQNVKRAIFEGMIRGFTFKDFLEKNVYAIPFKDKYSLVTSVDFARKLGMRSGVVGKSAPTYEEKDGKIISCTVTMKRKVGEYIGDYSATVFFDEYTTNRNLWLTKPRTMLAKVAEAHALRMACPEEMAQMYVEEEIQKEEKPEVDMAECKAKLEATKSIEELGKVWSGLPIQAKTELMALKDILKQKYDTNKV